MNRRRTCINYIGRWARETIIINPSVTYTTSYQNTQSKSEIPQQARASTSQEVQHVVGTLILSTWVSPAVPATPTRAQRQTTLNTERVKSICSVHNCNTSIAARGLCSKHGAHGICPITGCNNSVVARGLCVKHGGKGTCSVKGCQANVKARKRCGKHQKSDIITQSDPGQAWEHIQRIAAPHIDLSLTVPMSLPSGTDPYTINQHSTAELKQELKVATTRQLAAYMRLLQHKEHYKTPAHIPFDHLDEHQYPLAPRRQNSKKDNCGYAINTKHYLYARYCHQIKRSLTTTHVHSNRYAQRHIPINGDWFQFEFLGGQAFNHQPGTTSEKESVSLLAIAFLAYCISWELKGRPVQAEESHDRLDNNRGYTMANTRSRTKSQQAWNRESSLSRVKYRIQIQDAGGTTRNYIKPNGHSFSFTDDNDVSKLSAKSNKAHRIHRIKRAKSKTETPTAM